jgi:hypothetical protein
MDDMKLAECIKNLRKSSEDVAWRRSKLPLSMAKDIAPVITEEVFGYFKDGIEFEINDLERYSDSSLKSLLESHGIVRFYIQNDALHLRRKVENKEILEIIANRYTTNLISCPICQKLYPQKPGFLKCIHHF